MPAGPSTRGRLRLHRCPGRALQLVVPAHDPLKIFQWDTLVRRDHRGHRLGIATKVHNLAVVQALHPDRTTVHTWNAESNHHMIAVNEAMGFVPVRYEGEYYREI